MLNCNINTLKKRTKFVGHRSRRLQSLYEVTLGLLKVLGLEIMTFMTDIVNN